MSIRTSTFQYAVITVRNGPERERLVIAYSDEKALRNLIAAPSIVALGYSSRAEANAHIDRCAATPALSMRAWKIGMVHFFQTFVHDVRVATRRLVNVVGCF